MADGPGKYDDVCTVARVSTQAEAVVLIVCAGNKGSGFSCQSIGKKVHRLPELLRAVADQIEEDAT
jgi:hypothetical protein